MNGVLKRVPCSTACGAECNAGSQNCNPNTCTYYCTQTCIPGGCPSGWKQISGSCYDNNQVCCSFNAALTPTPGSGGPYYWNECIHNACQNTPHSYPCTLSSCNACYPSGQSCSGTNPTATPTPTPCLSAQITSFGMTPISKGNYGSFNTVDNASVTTANANRVDFVYTVTNNKDSKIFQESGNNQSNVNFLMDVPTDMPAPTPGESYNYNMIFNAWDTCGGTVNNHYASATVHMQMPSLKGLVYLDNNRSGNPAGQPLYTSGKIKIDYSWNDGSGSTYTTTTGQESDPATGTYAISMEPNTYTVTLDTLPVGYAETTPTIWTGNVSAQDQLNFGILPVYTVSGNVFKDYNIAEKPDYAPVQDISHAGTIVIKDSNGKQAGPIINIDDNGAYTTGEILFAGTYSVTFTPSSSLIDSYTITTPKVFTVTVGNGCAVGGSLTASCLGGSIQNLGFGMTPYYTVSGIIYDDLNLDQYYTPLDQKGNIVDTPITTGTVTATGPMNATATITTSGATKGNYVFSGHTNGLIRGTYTLTYNPVGTNQAYSYPPNYQVQVTVGMPGISSIAPCDASNGHNYDNQDSGGVIHHYLSVCDTNGNIVMTGNPFGDGRDLNFGINDTETSTQTTCGDIRVTGLTDHLPATGTCGGVSNAYASVTDSTLCPNSPGIAFCQNQSCDFGNGSASVNNWQVGSTTDPEVFQPINACVIRTSTQYLTDTASQNGIQTTPLTTICPNLSDCILPGNLANGIYTANSDVTMEGYTFSSTARVAFIINGNLTITGNIIVPVGGVAAFSASGNIYIDKSVGVSDPSIICDPSTQIGCNIEGLFSAGNQIIVESARTSPTQACNFDGTSQDLRINFAGSFVTGANCTNATITNQRDLCKADTTCPVQMITQRGDMLLNAYSFNFLLHENSAWKEVNP